MTYKEDWDRCKERYCAFWQGGIVDRCCISVTAPKKSALQHPGIKPKSLQEKWKDPEYRLKAMLHECETTFYGGEAYPNLWLDLGPGVVAAFMGAQTDLGEDCIWFDRKHIIDKWEDRKRLVLDENSESWQLMMQMTEYLCQNAAGRYHVSITDLGGTLDIAADFRGAQELLYDLIDQPGEVRRLCDEIDEVWIRSFDVQNAIISKYMEGTSDWYNLWCPENCYAPQSDFSVMISPSQFAEFTLPSIRRQIEHLDKSLYHLHAYDTPGGRAHLELLLDLPGLSGIHWVSESYNSCGDEKWIPLYKRVQEKGKLLALHYVNPWDIEKLLEHLSPKGLHITTRCESEDEARELLRKLERWSCRH